MDRYKSFAALRARERAGVDYTIHRCWGSTGAAVMVPHGGRIEPGTSEIGRAIAEDRHTFYEFAGIKPAGNFTLHIRSEHFDEPRALEVIERSSIVLVIHGCSGSDERLYVGGTGSFLQEELVTRLTELGLTIAEHPVYRGRHPNNLCNRKEKGCGIQLEFSAALRRRLVADGLETWRHRGNAGLAEIARTVHRVVDHAMERIQRQHT